MDRTGGLVLIHRPCSSLEAPLRIRPGEQKEGEWGWVMVLLPAEVTAKTGPE